MDMRWGGQEVMTVDHETWEYCARELVRCLHESEGPFFLSLQADKYGYCPLPLCIEKEVLEARVEQLRAQKTHSSSSSTGVSDSIEGDADAVVNMIHEWYQLDCNHLPHGRYVLKRLPDDENEEVRKQKQAPYWDKVLPTLVHALDGLPIMTDTNGVPAGDGLLRVGRSVTEYEVKCGLRGALEEQEETINGNTSSSSLAARVLWLYRTFENQNGEKVTGEVQDEESSLPRNRHYDDSEENYERKGIYRGELLAHMHTLFPAECVYRNPPGLSLDAVIARCNAEQELLKEQSKSELRTDMNEVSLLPPPRPPQIEPNVEGGIDCNENPSAATAGTDTDASVSDRPQSLSSAVDTYRGEFETFALSFLTTALQRIIDRQKRWAQDGEGLNLGGQVLGELLHHYQWGRVKCASFAGREAILAQAMDRLFAQDTSSKIAEDDRHHNGPFKGICFALVGASGSGKTALMARLADLSYQKCCSSLN